MADISNLLFTNAGNRREDTSSADTLKYLSFKTDTFELTDTKLGVLVNLGSTATGDGASEVGVEDSAGNFTGTDVEAVLAELQTNIDGVDDSGVIYLTDGTGSTIGDALFISANDVVSTYSTIANDEEVIGLAASTVGVSANISVTANDTVVAGILTAASAGDVFYWDGSTQTTTFPSGAGAHAWKIGAAKNANDLHVQIAFQKKNA